MSQENKPQFSHITVGQIEADASAYGEDEEVIAIGAVDVSVGTDPDESTGTEADPEDDVAVGSDESTEADPDESAGADPDESAGADSSGSILIDPDGSTGSEADPDESAKALSEADLIGPMPLMQKLVIAACFIAVLVTIVFLVWFWVTQR
jgi:hypothetical protein